MKLSDIESRNGKHALPKYLGRYGKDWVQTRGNRNRRDAGSSAKAAIGIPHARGGTRSVLDDSVGRDYG